MTATYNLIDVMEDQGILTEITGAQRNRLYLFERYMNLFAGESMDAPSQ